MFLFFALAEFSFGMVAGIVIAGGFLINTYLLTPRINKMRDLMITGTYRFGKEVQGASSRICSLILNQYGIHSCDLCPLLRQMSSFYQSQSYETFDLMLQKLQSMKLIFYIITYSLVSLNFVGADTIKIDFAADDTCSIEVANIDVGDATEWSPKNKGHNVEFLAGPNMKALPEKSDLDVKS
ncbi:MAG: hypothetical protein ACJZ81_00820 [Paracoccaceae bacterium]